MQRWHPPVHIFQASSCVPSLKPVLQAEAAGQANRPLSQKAWGGVSACCGWSALGVAAGQELALGLLWFPWTQGCKHPRPPEPDSQGSSSGPQLKDRHQVHLTTPIRETPALWKAAEDGACPQSSLERITVSSYTCV